ncbi:hypothetical protein [Rubritalea marina]|uniref:hypothetical protein n=1 Tax=Rubritalea marina TaxID=361055 RepID=UPI00035EFFF8|nr:hypothetical protein [Rubritalea marina]
MKFIVTTTINSPTEATLKYCEIVNKLKDWTLLVVGDTKTPHAEYEELNRKYSNVLYLSPDTQESIFPELSETIGWCTIQRRNIGFVYAYSAEAELIATVDDDNIPYDHWGQGLLIGQEIEYDCYECSSSPYFDPLSITEHNQVWHRGYPIEYVPTRLQVEYKGKRKRTCLVQANLWDGDPDIDAMARLTHKPIVRFDPLLQPYGSSQIAPFNSQNTLLAREVIPYYAVLPFVGRMDDIWGAYILQSYFPDSVIYAKATVYQDRNVQDLITNLEAEVMGYRKTLDFLKLGQKFEDLMPEATKKFWKLYRQHYEHSSFQEMAREHHKNWMKQ